MLLLSSLSARFLLSCVVLALSLQLACGWLATGHMLTAQIAQKYLNRNGGAAPGVLAAVDNALTSLLTYTDDSNTFVTAAVWMDDLKFRALNQYDEWHYVNLPVCDYGNGTVTGACNNISIASVLGTTGQVVWAIGQARKTIGSKTALGYERGFALRNLLHLVGDIHQPLHVANRFSPNTTHGDLGGNTFVIHGQYRNLHYLWDSGVGLLDNDINRPLNSSGAQYLSDMADQIMNRTAGLVASIGNGTNVTDWAMRSYNLSVVYTYNITYGSTPSADYIATSWEVIQDQLGLGGYRLALLLNEFYSCGSQNCPEPEVQIQKQESTWRLVGIVLAAVLGASVLLNFGLLFRSRRAKYEPVN